MYFLKVGFQMVWFSNCQALAMAIHITIQEPDIFVRNSDLILILLSPLPDFGVALALLKVYFVLKR